MRPLIGVMPLYDEVKESLWMLPEFSYKTDNNSKLIFELFVSNCNR